MKKNFSFLLPFLLLFISVGSISAQSTFATIHSILQTNCAGSGCHGGSNPLVFDVNASATDLRNALVGVTPTNPAAAQSGQKLVDPGHPYNSFLLKKIGSNNFDPYITKTTAEGNHMPSGLASLSKPEIELVRQWIIAGAPATGTVVNYQTLQNYYNNGGLPFINVPAAPDPAKGFQVRYGPIFLTPNQELEMMKKEILKNNSGINVGRMEGIMSDESHHMLLFKHDGNGSGTKDGTRVVPTEDQPFNGDITLTGAWQDNGDFELPQGTAVKWAPNTVLDFDYHIKNYSQTEILPADFYLNVYYYEGATTPIEMKAQLVNELTLLLKLGTNDITRPHIPGGSSKRHIWMISSHTHKFGTDYDIFIRNADGSKGEQIYEGFYNGDYTFNQGFYDWEHPAVRYFEPLKEFNSNTGLAFQTKWDVTGPCTTPAILQPAVCVTFGLTTADEMMLFTYMYTEEDISTSVANSNINSNSNQFSVYPNPFDNTASVSYSLEKEADVKIEVFNIMGKNVATLVNGKTGSGEHTANLESNYGSGIYFVTLTIDGNKVATKKITQL
jgi:hypothetical protein